MTRYTQALGECAANSHSSFSGRRQGLRNFHARSGKAYQKLDTGRTFSTGYTLPNEIIALTLRWARAKNGPVCRAKGTDYAVVMLSQAGEMTNGMPVQSASSVIRATESSGDNILWAPICRQTLLLSGRMPGCRRFPMICVTFNRTRPGPGISIALADVDLAAFCLRSRETEAESVDWPE
jgi:hypothetical protein